MQVGQKIIIFLIWALQACQPSFFRFSPTNDEKAEAKPLGGVLSHLYSAKSPLMISCYRLSNFSTKTELPDLELERHADGTFAVYLRQVRYGVPKGPANLALYPVVVEGDWYHVDRFQFERSLVFMDRHFPPQFKLTYIRENDGESLHSTLAGGYWDEKSDEENIHCTEKSPLASKPPLLDERLYVMGVGTNLETNVQEKTVQAIKVDGLTTRDGQEVIISLTNKLPLGQFPLKSPVYNRNRELVGFVLEHKQGALAGITIGSIHDKKMGALIKKSITSTEWNPQYPTPSALSQRFMHTICNRIMPVSHTGCDPWRTMVSKAMESCPKS